MALQQHYIRKQVVQLKTSPGTETSQIQQDLSMALRHEITSGLDNLFSSLTEPEEYLRIDRLEIDLGTLPQQGLTDVFAERLYEEIKKQLKPTASKNKSILLSGNPISHEEEQRDAEARAENTQVIGFQKSDSANSVLAAFFHFLEYAQFPWWSDIQIPLAQFEQQIQEVLINTPDIIGAQHRLLLKKKKVQERLVRQFSTKLLQTLIQLLAGDEQSIAVDSLQKTVFQKTGLSFSDPTHREWFWILILQYVTGEKAATKSIRQKEGETASSFETWLISALQDKLAFFTTKAQERNTAKQEQKNLDQQKQASNIRAEEQATAYFKKQLEKSNTPRDQAQSKESPIAPADCIISNAGLVLIAPYLSRFFEKLDLVKDGQFKNEEMIESAIHLLDYLCWGNYQKPEYQQGFNKILCGIPINQTIHREWTLDQTMLDEADHLLGAVISHWKALKNTSPDGLRQAFLQREGELFFKADGYHLSIKKETMDILLSSIPWGFSMIQLPWMDRLLLTDWS